MVREWTGVGGHVQIISAASWGLSAGCARYYGRRWFVHAGPWLFFVWQLKHPATD